VQHRAARVLASYRDFAEGLVADGLLSDPWVDSAPRFRMTPIVLGRERLRELYAAAEAVTAVHGVAAELCARHPALVSRFFDLPPSFQAMWQMSAPAWHGIARADVFVTSAGVQVCELNSDTPSGAPEAVSLNRSIDGTGATFLDDPNRGLADRICAMVAAVSDPIVRPAAGLSLGIVYPTEMTEDLSMIKLYARWFRTRGMQVVLGSPFNLRDDGQGGVALLGVPCQVIWRHYKTDWWGERRPVSASEEPFPDAAPLARPLALLAAAVARGRCAIVNPFGAVLTQNKRMLALLWEELHRFPAWAQAAIRAYVPYTVRLETLPVARLRGERAQWVLKSDYGCEGEEVVIGADTDRADWAQALADAVPRRWIAQRRFHPCREHRQGAANYGVYVVGGQAAGIFTRLQPDGTDRRAVCAPTMVRLAQRPS
jgi:glutathionylspermidine synthase